jgi:hypothetical protein
MARAAVAIELTDEEERELRALLRRPSVSQQQALRARIVLRASEGATNTQIAAHDRLIARVPPMAGAGAGHIGPYPHPTP